MSKFYLFIIYFCLRQRTGPPAAKNSRKLEKNCETSIVLHGTINSTDLNLREGKIR